MSAPVVHNKTDWIDCAEYAIYSDLSVSRMNKSTHRVIAKRTIPFLGGFPMPDEILELIKDCHGCDRSLFERYGYPMMMLDDG